MDRNKKDPLLSKARLLSSNIIDCLSKSLQDVSYMNRATALKAELDDLTKSVSKLKDIVNIDVSDNKVNVEILIQYAEVSILNKTVVIAIDSMKEKNYQLFQVIKTLMSTYSNQLSQQNTSAGEEDKDGSTGASSSWNEEEEKKYVMQHLKETSILFHMMKSSEDTSYALNLIDRTGKVILPKVSIDQKDNLFYQIASIVFYKQNELLINEQITFSKLVSYSRDTRERLFKILLICEWMLQHSSKMDEDMTNTILPKIAKFVSNKSSIIEIRRLCRPYFVTP